MRLIWLAVIAWVLYWVWRKRYATPPAPPPQTPAQAMVKCAHCDVHVPQQQALPDNEHWFCCQQHKDAFYSS